ncbi:hypothetical protein [Undibacterium sp. TJN19]|uniref:hypothetical protein n=1 Tax=Undibacterium sp. TJN19 TaxID=3413055 RepID=UPI003BF331B4
MTNDEFELLKYAAIADEVNIIRWNDMLATYETLQGLWNPLRNNGNAMFLAAKLRLSIMYRSPGVVHVSADRGDKVSAAFAIELLGEDSHEATRRAIVRVAAKIGKAKQ